MRRSCWAAFTERARDVGAEGRSVCERGERQRTGGLIIVCV